MDKIQQHAKLCEQMHDTYVRKNHDYGDSFGKSCGKYGITAAMVRMEDKWNRLDNLVSKQSETKVGDESILDTLMDLSNYALMTYMELIDRKEERPVIGVEKYLKEKNIS